MPQFASAATAQLYGLAVAFVEHEGMSLDALSGRALGKGGFFARLARGGDCTTRNAERLRDWFAEHWPLDLPWCEAFGPRPARAGLAVPEVPGTWQTPLDLARLASDPVWPSGRRPEWWSDIEVRDFLTATHRQMSTLRAEALGAARFGDRCPKKSAIHAYWQRLDQIAARGSAEAGGRA